MRVKDDWARVMQAMNKSPEFGVAQIAVFNVIGFLTGIAGVWLYAAIRPRYGAGLKTAILTAVALWFVGNFLPNLGFLVMDVFPKNLLLIATIWGFAEVCVGMALGAWLYREELAGGGVQKAATAG